MKAMMNKVKTRKKDHAFVVIEEKKRIWKGSNAKLLCYHCVKPGDTRENF